MAMQPFRTLIEMQFILSSAPFLRQEERMMTRFLCNAAFRTFREVQSAIRDLKYVQRSDDQNQLVAAFVKWFLPTNPDVDPTTIRVVTNEFDKKEFIGTATGSRVQLVLSISKTAIYHHSLSSDAVEMMFE